MIGILSKLEVNCLHNDINFSKDFVLEIRNCIKNKDYRALMDNGGFELYLLPRWQNFVYSLPKTSKYMFLEYLNDIDKRKIIADVIENCIVPSNLLDQLFIIDNFFQEKTIETNVCICGENDLTDIYPKSNFWYYYRIPKEHIEYWKSDIEWLNQIAKIRGTSLFL